MGKNVPGSILKNKAVSWDQNFRQWVNREKKILSGSIGERGESQIKEEDRKSVYPGKAVKKKKTITFQKDWKEERCHLALSHQECRMFTTCWFSGG